MTQRALLLGLLLALPVSAADPPPEIIDGKALDAEFRDFLTRVDQMNKNAVPKASFVQYYRDRAQAKGTPREQAVAALFYGVVLHKIVDNAKDAKREYQRAINLCPGLLPAYSELARVAEEAGDRAEAERLIECVIRMKKDDMAAWLQLAQMAQRRGDLERAKELYTKSLEFDTDVAAFVGLITVNTRLYQASFDEKAKEKLARETLDLAHAVEVIQPNNPHVRLSKAQVLLDLGRKQEAREYLEALYAEGTSKPEVEVEILRMLRIICQMEGDVAGVKGAIDRMLKNKNLRPEERARLAARVKDLDAMDRWAFTKWEIEEAVQILKNEGLSVEDRVYVLRRLIGFCSSEAVANPELRPLVKLASDECFRQLVSGTPELVLTQLRALRNGAPVPRLMSVLVHFIYPKGVTEDIREEGCRIVAAAGGVAAIPALFYSLQDDSGRVVREADSQLSVLCERRSPFGGNIDPLTPEQVKQARRAWTDYFHSEEGATRLATAFGTLSGCVVKVNPTLAAAPMIDHAANILLDGDVPWAGWAASYAFLVAYWGKDFRPVERRGKQIEPFERDAVVEAFNKEFNPEEPAPPAPPPPAKQPPAKANAGVKKG